MRQALYVDRERLIDSGRPSRRFRDLAFDLGPRKRRPYAAQSLASVSSWLAFPRPRSSESENESEAPVFILAAVTDFCQDGQFSLLGVPSLPAPDSRFRRIRNRVVGPYMGQHKARLTAPQSDYSHEGVTRAAGSSSIARTPKTNPDLLCRRQHFGVQRERKQFTSRPILKLRGEGRRCHGRIHGDE